MKTLGFYLRVGLTGLWFFFGTFVSLCLLPFHWKDPSVGATLGRIVSWGGCRLMGWRVRVENAEALYSSQPCIYVANHQSNMDIITMGCMYPYRTVVIGKKQLKWVPLFGWFFWGCGMIMIDRENLRNSLAGLEHARDELLRTGHSIMIFPEGTRNRGRGLLPFKKGAFHIAIAAQVPVVPFVHQHLYSYLDVAGRRSRRGEVLIRVLDPISTVGMTVGDVPRLAASVRERIADELCKPEMKHSPEVPVLRTPAPRTSRRPPPPDIFDFSGPKPP